MPHFKRSGAVPKGECFNSPVSLESHSPVGQSNLETSEEKEACGLAKDKHNPWTRLIGRANEEQIMINGHPVTALLDAGSQVTHISEAFAKLIISKFILWTNWWKLRGLGGPY